MTLRFQVLYVNCKYHQIIAWEVANNHIFDLAFGRSWIPKDIVVKVGRTKENS